MGARIKGSVVQSTVMARQANRGDAPRQSEPGRERSQGIELAKPVGSIGVSPQPDRFRTWDGADGGEAAFVEGHNDRRHRGFGDWRGQRGRAEHRRKSVNVRIAAKAGVSPYHAADITAPTSLEN